MTNAIDSNTEPRGGGEGSSRKQRTERIVKLQQRGLRSDINVVPDSVGGYRENRTIYSPFPQGKQIEIKLSGTGRMEKDFSLLRPFRVRDGNVVTQYREATSSSSPVLAFAEKNDHEAGSFLTAQRATVSREAARESLPAAARESESRVDKQWYDQNWTSGKSQTHYLIDNNGRAVRIEEFDIDSIIDSAGNDKDKLMGALHDLRYGERTYGNPQRFTSALNALVSEVPQLTSYQEEDGHFFRIEDMTDDDFDFYEEAYDAYRDATDPRTKFGKFVGDKAREVLELWKQSRDNLKDKRAAYRQRRGARRAGHSPSETGSEQTPQDETLTHRDDRDAEPGPRRERTFSLDDLRSEMMQRNITAPDAPTEDIAGIFAMTNGAVPDSFAAHQYFRILYPDSYSQFINKTSGSDSLNAENMRRDVLLLSSLSRIVRQANEGDTRVQERLLRFRTSLLKLNEIIVSGQDPKFFDWQGFVPPSEPQNE